MRILVVEDSRTQAESLRYILEKKGYTVTLATNGRDALEQIRASRPDLVLTDIVMPEMDGYEFCHRIKTDQDLHSVPVIIVTQLFDPVDVVRGLEAGADNFIIKPYEPKDIEARIQTVITTCNTPDPEVPGRVFEITLAGERHTITADRRQILDILLSTYDITVRKNAELLEAHEQLNLQSDRLQQAVADLEQANRDLQAEDAERRKVEKALAEANKKLHLMAGITRHDITNQLMILDGFIALIQEKNPDFSNNNYLSHITAASRRIANLIQFTREYEKVGVHAPTWQDIRILADTAGRDIVPGRITLVNDLPADREVFADPLIAKVFFNLIDNALRHGGKITTIRFSFEDRDGDQIIVCADDGEGIPADEKERIFERGFGKNTGFGLTISREILAITGITISETGIPHKGARFELKCPKGTIRGMS